MKKFILAAVVTLFSIAANAQEGKFAVGAQVLYPTDVKSLGVGAKASYGFTDAIQGQASFNYFLKKNYTTVWDVNADAHYLFNIGNNAKIYPLAGLTYMRVSIDSNSFAKELGSAISDITGQDVNKSLPQVGSSSDGKFGVNLGGGIQYALTESLLLNAEVKFQIVRNYNQAVLSAGIAYAF